jgi:hypothetical protein
LLNEEEIKREKNYLTVYNEIRDVVKYIGALDDIDLKFIPVYNGVSLEFELLNEIKNSRIEIEIDIGDFVYENYEAGYALIFQEEPPDKYVNPPGRVGIIYQAVAVDRDGRFYPDNHVRIYERNRARYFTIDLSALPPDVNYPVTVSLNFDVYFHKMFFNNSVREAIPRISSPLNNVSIFDTINPGNNGYTYLKYNLRSITPKDPELIDSFYLNFYVMAVDGDVDLEVFRLANNWCSWVTTWKNRPRTRQKIGYLSLSEAGWHTIDLTEYIKRLIAHDYYNISDNSIVFKMKKGSEGHAIFASANNSFTPPYFEINYRVQ